ncbi:MAG: ribonuclease HII [Caldiserica bacterium]|nr:ribonuclease HII [Caldisericota bacterium]MDH7562893.1 ribonuclease HII [Caldisericota bacterium]
MELLTSSNLWSFDLPFFEKFKTVCGIDEAGRGPLAGPLVACAVAWSQPCPEIKVKDSKALSEEARRALFFKIIHSCLKFSFGIVTPLEINHLNMHQANLLAFKRAFRGLGLRPGVVLIDGKWSFDGAKNPPQIPVIKGDAKSGVIASASILAKVYRDTIMLALDKIYPIYGFGKHKGYATRDHFLAIEKEGISCEHRINWKCLRSFLEDGEL